MAGPYEEHATLVVRPTSIHYDATNYDHTTDKVVGLETERTPMQYEHGYEPSESDTTLELSMHFQHIGRLASFYDACISRAPGKRAYYNPSIFAGYMLNARNSELHSKTGQLVRAVGRKVIGKSSTIEWDVVDDEVNPNETMSGAGYMLLSSQPRILAQMLIGTPFAGKSLSVVGERGPLLLSSNAEMLRAFDAPLIRAASPRK